mgnify:FL=1
MADLTTLTLDVETTMASSHKNKAHFADPENRLVLMGMKYTAKNDTDYNTIEWGKTLSFEENLVDIIIGHNLTFDLHYVYKTWPSEKLKFQKVKLWDTQLAAYILSGQQHKFASLDELSAQYKLPLKYDKVKEYFDAGFGADLVPINMLKEYLKQDVYNTETIAYAQMKQATELNMLPLIISQMEALHATIEMTYNGLQIDGKQLADYTAIVHRNMVASQDESTKLLKELSGRDVDIASNKQLSIVLFGGTVSKEEKIVAGMYKNGKPKYKKEKVIEQVPPLINPKNYVSKNGSVDDKVLSELIATHPAGGGVCNLLYNIKQYREYSKEYSTYCQSLYSHIMTSGRIYGNISHVNTNTGRLSSSSPNLQNISNSLVKKSFCSRFPNGKLMEFDFSQLEVAILAHISNDKQLIKDITEGADIHSELYKDMYGKYPTKEDRKWFKTLTFGLLYGAGPKTLADNAKCDIAVANKFIDTFYSRYWGVQRYHIKIQSDADREAVLNPGDVKRTYSVISETGRRYVFKEYEASEWVKKISKRKFSFSPTELKNYPVQGLATADIVPLMLGILFRNFVGDEEVALVNTIHDSILFDVQEQAVDRVHEKVVEILGNTHTYYENTFGVPLKLPLSVGCNVGSNWYDMTECKV